VFEIERDEGEIRRFIDASGAEHLPFPLLHGGDVNFEDADIGEWIAVGESIQTGAED